MRVCPDLAARLALAGIYVKDESCRLGLNSFKALGASWAISQVAQAREQLPVFAAATDGNHGRAVAWMARRLGAHAVIFVPSNAVPSRLEDIRDEGAEVRIGSGTYDDAVRDCAAQSRLHGWQVIADTGYDGYLDIPHSIMLGYQTLFDEYEEQLRELDLAPPDLIVIQAGVGGLLCAAVQHFRRAGGAVPIVCIEPAAAACLFASISSKNGVPRTATGAQDSVMDCLNCGEVSLAAWPAIRRGVDLFAVIEDALAIEAVQQFSRPAPGDPLIQAGPSGAAGLAGLFALRQAGHYPAAQRVLLVNTEAPLRR